MEILGHALFLVALMLTFLSAMLSIMLSEALRGGRISKAVTWEAIGLIVVAIGVFTTYAGAITGKLNLLDVTLFWPFLGIVILIGFACICYGKWQMMKVI